VIVSDCAKDASGITAQKMSASNFAKKIFFEKMTGFILGQNPATLIQIQEIAIVKKFSGELV
jgi:hypothetical protein